MSSRTRIVLQVEHADVPTGKPPLILYAHSLECKWGFQDGDLLKNYLNDCGVEYNCCWQEILVLAVKRHLIPEIEECGFKVVSEVIGTIHNTIRVREVNGVEVDHYKPTNFFPGDLHVEIPFEEVLLIIKVLEYVNKVMKELGNEEVRG